MAKNPYTLLGVKKDASKADIKKAYRQLAKKLHPDTNNNDPKVAERFKEVTAAYSLLSNDDMRKQYDTGQVDASGQQQNPFAGGGNPFGGGGPQTGFGGFGGFNQRSRRAGGQDDMADLFSSLFGMNMGGMQGGMDRPPMRPQKGADVRYKMQLPLLTALEGGTKSLQGGLKVKLPAGVKDGQVLRLRGKGRPGVNGGPAGDAKIEINIKPHKNLRREGDDLHLDLPITLSEAAKGAKVDIPMPQGTVKLTIPPGTNTGKRFRLSGKGAAKGDLYVTTLIKLTDAEISALPTMAKDWPDMGGADIRNGLL
jgi:DnaJ-class molecular chaperone